MRDTTLDWVKVLLPALGMPASDADVVMEWRELMEGLTVLEARSREWPREWLEEGREQGRESNPSKAASKAARN